MDKQIVSTKPVKLHYIYFPDGYPALIFMQQHLAERAIVHDGRWPEHRQWEYLPDFKTFDATQTTYSDGTVEIYNLNDEWDKLVHPLDMPNRPESRNKGVWYDQLPLVEWRKIHALKS